MSAPIVRTWEEAAVFARRQGKPPTEDDCCRFPDGRLVRTREDLLEFLALIQEGGDLMKDGDASHPPPEP